MQDAASIHRDAGLPGATVPAAAAEGDALYAAAQVSPWTARERLGRALWMIVRGSLFRWSWHNWYGWRNSLLRLFGANIGRHVVIRPTTRIEVPWLLTIGDYSSLGDFTIVYNLGPVTIGRRCTISQYAHLCAGTHDFTRWSMPLLRPPITIGDDVWVAAEAFVGPGINVGEGAILGARASAFRDVPPWTINIGNPARSTRQRLRPTG